MLATIKELRNIFLYNLVNLMMDQIISVFCVIVDQNLTKQLLDTFNIRLSILLYN